MAHAESRDPELRASAESYRLWQAEQWLREVGYIRRPDGSWHPVEE